MKMSYLSIPLGNIFLSQLSKSDIYKEILRTIKKRGRMMIFPLNMHSLRLIHKHADIQRVFRMADIVFPDGVPILWIARHQGNTLPGRVSGTDLVERILKTPNIRVFLLGSTKNILTQISKSAWVQAKIVGTASPHFKEAFNKKANAKLIKHITGTKPHILLVALGQPKQELFLSTHLRHISPCIGIGVGSAFDILSGRLPRAPKIFQTIGFEWAWRLFQNPHHLLKRYLSDAQLLAALIFTNK
jgi:N-acetylglucosaminyldiphosphoundecaprenol N-acetyl-beta-D-mannosaminyltransferase